MEPYFIGEICMFGGNFAPRNWAFCDGQLLPISQNSALFSILGTTFGGDGRTTFALPDLRGRFAIGAGNGPGLTPRVLGARGGSETVTLTTNELPSHNHPMTGATIGGNVTIGVNEDGQNSANPTGGTFTEFSMYNSGGTNGSYAHTSTNLTVGGNTGLNGGSQSHTNLQPYSCVNYIIALFGTYPSRS